MVGLNFCHNYITNGSSTNERRKEGVEKTKKALDSYLRDYFCNLLFFILYTFASIIPWGFAGLVKETSRRFQLPRERLQ